MFMTIMDTFNHMNSSELYQQHNQYLIYDRMGDVEQDIVIVKKLMDTFQKDLEGNGDKDDKDDKDDKIEYVPNQVYTQDIRQLRDRITILENDIVVLQQSECK
jgi:hypothetical protein